jgi:hypothetical protein
VRSETVHTEAAREAQPSATTTTEEPVFKPTPPTQPLTTPPQRDASTLESVKSNVKGQFEDDDLDVPAFIRKRNQPS